jgi:hypothetical protein
MSENPEHFIKWLLPDAEFKGKAKYKSPNLNDRQIEADNLYAITLNNLRCLIHIEFQSKYDKHMARRLWEYNTLATFKYKLPAYSFVIYLKKCTVTKPEHVGIFPNGKQIHHFQFTVIKLWETPAEMLKQTGLVGIFPLMVLAQDGKRPEVVEEVITSLEAVGGEAGKELLSLTYIFASLTFEREADRRWLKGRFKMLRDVLRDTWAYQEIMQEGREEERRQRLKDQRQAIMTMIQLRFPNTTRLAKQQADAIEEPEILQNLLLELLAIQTEEQAEQILLMVSQKKKK